MPNNELVQREVNQSENDALESLKHRLRKFAADRDWDQFHSPKNLSMALIAEAAELVEHFQWLTEEQSAQLPSDKLAEVEEELADTRARDHLLVTSGGPASEFLDDMRT
ncbi:MAG: nucleotide pyrophosphohydrolase [Thiohalomonadales bacterium]